MVILFPSSSHRRLATGFLFALQTSAGAAESSRGIISVGFDLFLRYPTEKRETGTQIFFCRRQYEQNRGRVRNEERIRTTTSTVSELVSRRRTHCPNLLAGRPRLPPLQRRHTPNGRRMRPSSLPVNLPGISFPAAANNNRVC